MESGDKVIATKRFTVIFRNRFVSIPRGRKLAFVCTAWRGEIYTDGFREYHVHPDDLGKLAPAE